MLDRKKGQIGETMTWIVATLIIIVILIFSVMVASGSDFAKNILNLDRSVGKIGGDRIVEKSFYSYLLTGDGQVYRDIKSEGSLNKINGDLAKSIFKEFYDDSGEYEDVWLGITNISEYGISKGEKNVYFGSRPKEETSYYGKGDIFTGVILSRVPLGKESFFEMFFVRDTI